MKRILYNTILGCTVALLFSACISEMDRAVESEVENASGNIILDIASTTQQLSRVDAQAQGVELAISHIDVFICKPGEGENDDKSLNASECIHHERVTPSDSLGGSGTISLALKRDSELLEVGKEFYVYLIANSTMTTKGINEATVGKTVESGIELLEQSDMLVHFTGLDPDISHAYTELNPPQRFLMDGVAYKKNDDNDNAGPPETPTAVVLNDGQKSSNTVLKVLLKRAAAKIIVEINRDNSADSQIEEFVLTAPNMQLTPRYYFNKLPYTTRVMTTDEELYDPGLRITVPAPPISGFATWGADKITINTYAYPYDWALQSLDKQVHLVVNIPMMYYESAEKKAAGEAVLKENNFYQLPISKNQILKRNNLYYVKVNLNVLGSESTLHPVKLENIQYDVYPWETKTVGVGGETDRPKFLYVNEEEMEMYNIATDNTTLSFNSSSDVHSEITEVCYYDAFGQKQLIPKSDYDRYGLSVSNEEAMKGKITVKSNVPTNNAIRHITLTVTNDDNSEPRIVTIKQYPLEYITNYLGWYSCRDDFGGTDYEHLNGTYVAPNSSYSSSTQISNRYCGVDWSSSRWNPTNTNNNDRNDNQPDFGGKFRGDTIAAGNDDAGRAAIYYYEWDQSQSGSGSRRTYTYRVSSGGEIWSQSEGNPRMYCIHITSSSSEYTLGVPRLKTVTVGGETLDITDDGPDNALIVAPAFMFASQLGAVMSMSSREIAASHCAHYVEVYKNEKTGEIIRFDDWRLPTRRELEIAYKYQDGDNKSPAMDRIFTGDVYWSASGAIMKPGVTGNIDNYSKAIRCVRNAYEN